MIRYVVAVLLTVAIFAVSMPAVDQVAGENGEKETETAIAKLDEAATALYADEELAPKGERGARRTVTVRLPERSMLSDPVVTLRIERVTEGRSLVTYRVEGRSKQTHLVEAPVVNENGGPVELGGSGRQEFVLSLGRDDEDRPVVVVRRV
jgi:DNA segregation ATPase FtsK/SpoIIIE-like protein